MKRLSWLILFAVVISVVGFFSCEPIDETPTKSKMEGVWMVTAVYDSSGKNIVDKFEFPVVAFHLSSDNTVISSAGPMIMYIVYGNNKYTQIASKVDQVFNYAGLSFNGGEFFVGGGVQERFTLEMKLEGLPGQKALTTLLDLLGISNDYLDMVVYHKFMDVKVSFNGDDSQMTWIWDSQTRAVYNTKDNYGNYVLWGGWPVNNFQRCRVVLQRQTKTIQQVVQEHTK